MNTIELTGIKRPHIGQQEVFLDRRRFNAIATGRRWGKEELIYQLINESIQAGHKRLLILAPTKLSYLAFQKAGDIFKGLMQSSNSIDREIVINNLRIQFVQTEHYLNALDGFQGDRIIINEPDLTKDIINDVIKLSQVCLLDFQGDLYIIGTPKPKRAENDLPSVFKTLADTTEDNPYWAIFKMPTVHNPVMQYRDLKHHRESLSYEDYRAEFEGEFN